MCYPKEKFITILSDTKDKAVEFLSHIKSELETNEKLTSDFPEVCRVKLGRWKNDEIITGNNIKIMALGSGQKVRGRRNKEARPSLIIFDDVENEANTLTVDARDKLFDWFAKAALKMGTKGTNVVVIGTILHYGSLLSQLTGKNKMHGWDKRIYKSVISWATHQDLWQKWSAIFNYHEKYMGKQGKEAAFIFFRDNQKEMVEESKVLWPERESYYDLMMMREQEGERSFDSEKQNNPVDLRDCCFNPEELYYWEDQYACEEELISICKPRIYAGCDPATGESVSRGDYSAVVTVGRDHKTGIIYVLDADIDKRKPDALMETILTYCQMRRYTKFGIEINGFQRMIKDEFERRAAQRNIHAPVREIKNTTNKISRIMSLQPLIKSGYLRFSRKHTVLLEQMRYFPKGRHDDGIDALEMACRIARERGFATVYI